MKSILSVGLASSFLVLNAFAAVEPVSTATMPSSSPSSAVSKSDLAIVLVGGTSNLNGSMKASGGGLSEEADFSTHDDGGSAVNGVGAVFSTRVAPNFGFELGGFFQTKTYDLFKMDGEKDDRSSETTMRQLKAVVTGNILLNDYISIGAGPYAAVRIGQIENRDVSSGETSETGYGSTAMRRLDAGATIGIQGRIPMSPTMAFVAGIRYVHGLTNLYDADKINQELGVSDVKLEADMKTRDIDAIVGLSFAL